MIRRPRLKGHLTFFPLPGGALGVYGGSEELWRVELGPGHGRTLAGMLPFLDGSHRREEILAALTGRGSDAGAAAAMLDRLAAAGLIEESGRDLLAAGELAAFASQILFFSRFSGAGSGEELQKRLRESRVDVLVGGDLPRCLLRHLQRAGIGEIGLLGPDPETLRREAEELRRGAAGGFGWRTRQVRSAEPGGYAVGEEAGELLIVGLDRWDPTLLRAFNEDCLRRGVPWLTVRAAGVREGIVGPLFVPGATACFLCLSERLHSNLAFHGEHQALAEHLLRERTGSCPSGGLLAHFEVLAGLAVTEAVKLLTGIAAPRTAGAFLTFEPLSLETGIHPVLRIPRCPACAPAIMEPFPWSELPPLDGP
jgi:bacteriocin biosynthesis cyclodehydratase domain-containing protein